jgi:formylglycine-generating enzyme required for sulfatase activity
MLGSGGRGSGSQPFEGKGAAELWYRNSVWCSDAHALTSPVGKFQPNRFGLHDTIGNAWEWVEDCMNASYVDAPEDGSVWRTGNCGHRVMRGGSWSSVAVDARANKRLFRELSVRRADLGFRIARNL